MCNSVTNVISPLFSITYFKELEASLFFVHESLMTNPKCPSSHSQMPNSYNFRRYPQDIQATKQTTKLGGIV